VRWLPVGEVGPDLILAEDLVVDGRKLVRAGAPAPAPGQLARFRILAVPVADAWSKGVEPLVPLGDPNRFPAFGDRRALCAALVEDIAVHGQGAVLPFPYPGYPRWRGVVAALVAAACAFGMGMGRDPAEDAAFAAFVKAEGGRVEASEGHALRLNGVIDQMDRSPASGDGAEVVPVAKAAQAGFLFARYMFDEGASAGEALEALWAEVGEGLYPEVRRGLDRIMPYPPGAEVTLSDGRLALVVACTTGDLRRPLVRLPSGDEVDLSASRTLVVVGRRH
jgi:hypothetical protein